MDEHSFNQALDRLRSEPAPEVSSATDSNVLRRIRARRESDAGANVWTWLDGVVPQARFVLGACALALLATSLTSGWLLKAGAVPPDRVASARVALGFDSFASSPEFPFDRAGPTW